MRFSRTISSETSPTSAPSRNAGAVASRMISDSSLARIVELGILRFFASLSRARVRFSVARTWRNAVEHEWAEWRREDRPVGAG